MSVVVIGACSTGETFVAALRRRDEDVPIVIVDRALVGGECTYWACMPSKTLLRAPELLAAAEIAPGEAEAVSKPVDTKGVFWWRDQVVDEYDDSGHEPWLEARRARLVYGEARVLEPGTVQVGDERVRYDNLVIATGSSPAIPDLPGLEGSGYWTSNDATSANEAPRSLIVIGGGPVGSELAQLYNRLGSQVTIIQRGYLLSRQDRECGELIQQLFEEEGITVITDAPAAHIRPGFGVELSDSRLIEAEKLLIATGRRPNIDGFGFEKLDIQMSRRGIEVDDRLRAGEHVWAIGDFAGTALFTHVGKYQARVAAATIAGGDARADYRAIPGANIHRPAGCLGRAHAGRRSRERALGCEPDRAVLDVRTTEAPWFCPDPCRSEAPSRCRRGRRWAGGRGVARPAHTGNPCRGLSGCAA